MKRDMKSWCGIVAAVSLVVGLVAGSVPQVWAGNPNPGIAPNRSNSHGQSCGEWSDAWYRWVLSVPAESDPVYEPVGSVSFLVVGSRFENIVTRELTVPAGKALFLQMTGIAAVNSEEYGDPPWSEEQEAYLRNLLAEEMDAMAGAQLTFELDGRQLTDLLVYRCQTPVGKAQMVTVPDGNVFGIPAGVYGPMVTDGYYLMLNPLPPGEHIPHFTISEIGPYPMGDATYHLTVLKGSEQKD